MREPLEMIVCLAKHVDFVQQGNPYNLAVLQQRLTKFRNVLSMLPHNTIRTLEEAPGNTTPLARDEIKFIDSAADINALSRNLFRKLAESFLCGGTH